MGFHRHRFVQRFRVEGTRLIAREDRILDGKKQPSVRSPMRAQVRARGVRAIKWVLSRLLRWSGRALYAAPVLWVVHLLVRNERAIASVAILIFVGVVLLFFALLNLFIFASMFVWLADRKVKVGIPFEAPEDETMPLEAHRFVGRLRTLEASKDGDVLWRDAWAGQQRLSEGDDLVVERPGSDPLIVQLQATPEVLGRGETIEAGQLSTAGRKALGLGERERVSALSLRSGDQVEVFTQELPQSIPLETLQLNDQARAFHRTGDTAYRGGVSRADLVVCKTDSRITIRLVS